MKGGGGGPAWGADGARAILSPLTTWPRGAVTCGWFSSVDATCQMQLWNCVCNCSSHTHACASCLAVRAEADIVIAACGKAEYVTADWIKPGAAVVDVGINAVNDASAKKGYRLVGDVAYDEVGAGEGGGGWEVVGVWTLHAVWSLCEEQATVPSPPLSVSMWRQRERFSILPHRSPPRLGGSPPCPAAWAP